MDSRRLRALGRIFGITDGLDDAAVLARLGRLADGLVDGISAPADLSQLNRALRVMNIDGIPDLASLRRLRASGNAGDLDRFNDAVRLIRTGGVVEDAAGAAANVSRLSRFTPRFLTNDFWHEAPSRLTQLKYGAVMFAASTTVAASPYLLSLYDRGEGGEVFTAAYEGLKEEAVALYENIDPEDLEEHLGLIDNTLYGATQLYQTLNVQPVDLFLRNRLIESAMSEEGATVQNGIEASIEFAGAMNFPILAAQMTFRAAVIDEIHPDVEETDLNRFLAEGMLNDMAHIATRGHVLEELGVENITSEDVARYIATSPNIVQFIPANIRDGLTQLYPGLYDEIFAEHPAPEFESIRALISSVPITAIADDASPELRAYREINDAYFGDALNTGTTLPNGNQVIMSDARRVVTGAATFYDGVRNALIRDNEGIAIDADAIGSSDQRFRASHAIARFISEDNGYINVTEIEEAGIDLQIPETFAHLVSTVEGLEGVESQDWFTASGLNAANSIEDHVNNQLQKQLVYGMGANGIQYFLTPEEYAEAYAGLSVAQRAEAVHPGFYDQVIHPEVVEPSYARNPELQAMHTQARAATAASPALVADADAELPATLNDFAGAASADELGAMAAVANGSWRNRSGQQLDSLFNTISGLVGSGTLGQEQEGPDALGQGFDWLGIGFLTGFFSSDPIERFNSFAALMPVVEFLGEIASTLGMGEGLVNWAKAQVQNMAIAAVEGQIDAATDNPAIRTAMEGIGLNPDPTLSVASNGTTTETEEPEESSRFQLPNHMPG